MAKLPLTSIQVRTAAYEFAHGKRPSGRGYWAFDLGDGLTWWATSTERPLGAGDTAMLYREARHVALVEAQRRGVHSIDVLT